MTYNRNLIAIFLSLIIAVAIGVWIGSLAGSHAWRSLIPANHEKEGSGTHCHLVRHLSFRPSPGSEPLWVEWELCINSSDGGLDLQRVQIGKTPGGGDVIKAFENNS